MPIILTFISCKVSDLSNIDNAWQPYEKGDILIFENSKGIKEEIKVNKSYTSENKIVQPYEIGQSNSLINISTGKYKEEEIGLVRISKTKKGVYLGLSEHTLFTRFGIDIPISEMSVYKYNDIDFEECYLIKNLEKYRYGNEYKSTSILFSKKYGYIKFNLEDGSSIQLKEFIRGGINIFP